MSTSTKSISDSELREALNKDRIMGFGLPEDLALQILNAVDSFACFHAHAEITQADLLFLLRKVSSFKEYEGGRFGRIWSGDLRFLDYRLLDDNGIRYPHLGYIQRRIVSEILGKERGIDLDWRNPFFKPFELYKQTSRKLSRYTEIIQAAFERAGIDSEISELDHPNDFHIPINFVSENVCYNECYAGTSRIDFTNGGILCLLVNFERHTFEFRIKHYLEFNCVVPNEMPDLTHIGSVKDSLFDTQRRSLRKLIRRSCQHILSETRKAESLGIAPQICNPLYSYESLPMFPAIDNSHPLWPYRRNLSRVDWVRSEVLGRVRDFAKSLR